MIDVRTLPKMSSSALQNKKVLLRVDLNVPMIDSKVQDFTRIERIAPTVKALVNAGAKVLLISHLGRPKAQEEQMSLRHLTSPVSEVIGMQVIFVPTMDTVQVHSILDSAPKGSVILLENLRFFGGETKNDQNFAKQLSLLADAYVNDAFSCSHREHASIDAITEMLPSFAGLCLQEELKYLNGIVSERPAAAVIGGAKASTKIPMLCNLAEKVDFLILGGGLANTFLAALGSKVGSSVYERDEGKVQKVMETARKSGCKVICPVDHVVARDLEGPAFVKDNSNVDIFDAVFDVGDKTSSIIENTLQQCKMIFWNGPMGVFEHKAFSHGTIKLIDAMISCRSRNNATTIIGGGDSIFAIKSLGYGEKDFSYVSTGGGALLHFLSVA